ncbi:MAG: thymidine phosphorylase [Ignavibacteria bacterium]|nr:thymidine phosphorylase [Ignavibacteria bacterium]
MNPVELIRKKRNGETLTKEELESFVLGYVKGSIPDYQMSAFLMAVYFTGMKAEETVAFTDVMLRSGEIIDLSAIPGTKVGKHSTGGVGDKVSLILAPMVAACGVPVPMISGRGLGHTGGTLDKLESIPGFRASLSVEEYKQIIGELGLVLIGQTEEIAPADRKIYALRDCTATIESIPLIAGSIMSKKLAEGTDALVLDVKCGNGAFMREYDDSVALANALVAAGNGVGKKTIGFITDMNQPLGFAVGNWLEVVESVECLRGKDVPDLMEVTYVVGGAMLFLGNKADSIEEGIKLCQSAIWSGKAFERFLQIVERQGGDLSFIRKLERYPKAKYSVEVKSGARGYVVGFATTRLGLLAIDLGVGRKKVDEVIDPKAGMLLAKKVGDKVEKGETLGVIYTDRANVLDHAKRELETCIQVAATGVDRLPCIRAFVDANGIRPWISHEMH